MSANKQKGVSLIITFFIMIIILTIVLSISVLLYSEVKVIRNIGNSMASFYVADSGIEKVLYYEKQVRPLLTGGDCTLDSDCDPGQTCQNSFCTMPAPRGLCSMFDSLNNPYYCASGSNGETSIYCNSFAPTLDCPNPLVLTGTDCDPNSCKNCSVCFATTFDGGTYYTTAKVSPDVNTSYSDPDFVITSKGIFGGVQRQIEILIYPIK